MKAHCNGAEEAAETPRDTNSGPSAGRAFALWIALSGPLEGLYRAIFASNAKSTANRHKHMASAVRRMGLEANACVIWEVYHAPLFA